MNNRIREIREALQNNNGKKYTQTQFAEALHVTRDMIATYESGRVEPTPLFISSLCSTFNVNEEWLRTGKGKMFSPLDKEQEVALIAKRLLKDEYDGVIVKIMKNVAQLSYEDWKDLERLLEKILKEEKDSSNN